MKTDYVKKGLVVGIIFLFIGAGVYPAIAFKINLSSNSIINTSNELIEFPVQIFGLNGVKSYKILVTKQQYDDFQVLIERFKENFENADTMKESVKVYRDMVVSLNELGLLPKSMSIRDAEKLVLGPYYYLDKLGLLSDKTSNEELPSHTDGRLNNRLCLLSSQASNTWTFDLFFLICIFFVTYGYSPDPYSPISKSIGWIQTKNILKNWNFSGVFYGNLGIDWDNLYGLHWIGVDGFFGFHLSEDFIIGRARHVAIVIEPYNNI